MSAHVNRLMGHSHSGEKKTSGHASRMMGKHASGGMIGGDSAMNPGIAPNMSQYSLPNPQTLKRGGKARRRRRAEGGELPYEGTEGIGKSPIERRRGGRACHAEGDTVEKEEKLKRGGKARRCHRSMGGMLGDLFSMPINTMKSMAESLPFKDGGDVDTKKRGGRMRKRHAEGDEVEEGRLNRAMGGAGKMRKGVMNRNGMPAR